MKKFLLFILVLAAVSAVVYFFLPHIKNIALSPVKPGDSAKDFILGMKNGVLYRLSDFTGKNIIVISFLNNNEGSVKFQKILESTIKKIITPKSGIVWFNIDRVDTHAVINELAAADGITYRTLYSEIPSFYSFSYYPSLVIIDKKSIVNMVYSGYSPTMAGDIKKDIEELTR